MIKEFIAIWDEHKGEIQEKFEQGHPENYKAIIHAVVSMLHDNSNKYDKPDPNRIHEIDDGDYQGTLVYVIGGSGYQPYEYWYVKVSYGSCSGCDTLKSIRGYENGKPSKEQVQQYMTLALHIIQGLEEMS